MAHFNGANWQGYFIFRFIISARQTHFMCNNFPTCYMSGEWGGERGVWAINCRWHTWSGSWMKVAVKTKPRPAIGGNARKWWKTGWKIKGIGWSFRGALTVAISCGLAFGLPACCFICAFIIWGKRCVYAIWLYNPFRRRTSKTPFVF